MNQRIFFLGLLAFTLLFSCQENSDATNERPTDHFGNTFSTPFDGLDAFLNYQAKIEKRMSDPTPRSKNPKQYRIDKNEITSHNWWR